MVLKTNTFVNFGMLTMYVSIHVWYYEV